jgi:hypothetical protein
MFTK